MSLKNSVTPPGFDPGTVRLVAQRLNHYATPSRVNIFNYFIADITVIYLVVVALTVRIPVFWLIKSIVG
jgi:hypothetical protein